MLADLATLSALLAVSSLPLLPGLSDEFVFDDIPAVRDNPDLVAPDPRGILRHDFWGENLTSPRSHKSFRPVTTATFWLQARVPGLGGAASLKLVNIGLHCANTLLLHRLLVKVNNSIILYHHHYHIIGNNLCKVNNLYMQHCPMLVLVNRTKSII